MVYTTDLKSVAYRKGHTGSSPVPGTKQGCNMANKSSHKKQKFGMMPGDISKMAKIELLEKGQTVIRYPASVFQTISEKAGKAFKEILRSRERARLKERDKQEVRKEL